uniref:Uncharacterized protein n=1 Tax=Chromera velia CCMP2878 TaxID=1169474 RepID=A0A0G4HRJ0_9ALVE|eukprot:Cvel_1292.t1-p1 / transcript=Cvel_1292.t1 / gene=Cvel_1292 / organism=Chromera_velia_CCMP2878 / gene_product=E3 ubiquitin-protein ligase MIB1, putative / transcript_product=E3 ubiquitin-protein ligase MIB1, putative / location=Cvel_scaffold43:124611-132324(-) / protein_length=594 / sequence_SO=supercontig / SO=protein_coding / is_pseudo=false
MEGRKLTARQRKLAKDRTAGNEQEGQKGDPGLGKAKEKEAREGERRRDVVEEKKKQSGKVPPLKDRFEWIQLTTKKAMKPNADPIHIWTSSRPVSERLLAKRLQDTLESNGKALWEACRIGDKEDAQRLLESPTDINFVVNGSNPLHEAARGGHYQVVEVLFRERLGEGPDFTVATENEGMSALQLAVAGGHVEVVRRIMTQIGDILRPPKSKAKQTEMERETINRRDKDGRTALHLAVKNNDGGSVANIVKCHQSFLATDAEGRNAFHLAVVGGHRNALVEMVNVTFHRQDKNAPLVVKKALNAPDKNGRTPLHIAIQRGDLEIVHTLVSRGADLAKQDMDGLSALHIAVGCKALECVRLLIARGAPLQLQDKKGYSPLHLSVDRARKLTDNTHDAGMPSVIYENSREFAIMILLISKGADLKLRDANGVAPKEIMGEIVRNWLVTNLALTYRSRLGVRSEVASSYREVPDGDDGLEEGSERSECEGMDAEGMDISVDSGPSGTAPVAAAAVAAPPGPKARAPPGRGRGGSRGLKAKGAGGEEEAMPKRGQKRGHCEVGGKEAEEGKAKKKIKGEDGKIGKDKKKKSPAQKRR